MKLDCKHDVVKKYRETAESLVYALTIDLSQIKDDDCEWFSEKTHDETLAWYTELCHDLLESLEKFPVSK
jgi:hypothetical protein